MPAGSATCIFGLCCFVSFLFHSHLRLTKSKSQKANFALLTAPVDRIFWGNTDFLATPIIVKSFTNERESIPLTHLQVTRKFLLPTAAFLKVTSTLFQNDKQLYS
jgi:hypothetical protein